MSESLEDLGRRLTAELYKATQEKDMDRLDSMLGSAIQLVGMRGARTREGMLEQVRNLRIDRASVESRDFCATREGDVLVVTWTTAAKQAVNGRELSEEMCPRLAVWQDSGTGGWQLQAYAMLTPEK